MQRSTLDSQHQQRCVFVYIQLKHAILQCGPNICDVQSAKTQRYQKHIIKWALGCVKWRLDFHFLYISCWFYSSFWNNKNTFIQFEIFRNGNFSFAFLPNRRILFFFPIFVFVFECSVRNAHTTNKWARASVCIHKMWNRCVNLLYFIAVDLSECLPIQIVV